MHRFCYSSLDFPAELESYAPESDSAITVQLPYEVAPSLPACLPACLSLVIVQVERRKVLSEEEKRLKSEKQRENGLRLQQLAEERREKKVIGCTVTVTITVIMSVCCHSF